VTPGEPRESGETYDIIIIIIIFGFESTLLARQLHQERTQMEAQQ
jgi:hypothetical protein